MLGVGSGIPAIPKGGNTTVYRQRSVAREATVVDGHRRSFLAFNEVFNRQAVTMEPGREFGLASGAPDRNVSRIGELMAHLEIKYKLKES